MGGVAGAAGAAGSSAATGMAATSAGMAGSGSALGVGMGAGGATAASLGGSAMGTGTLAGSMAASSSAMGSGIASLPQVGMSLKGTDWNSKLKDMLGNMAEDKLGDLRSFSSQFSPNQQNISGYNESALKQGYKNSDLYNQLMQQQLANSQSSQIKRYNQGV